VPRTATPTLLSLLLGLLLGGCPQAPQTTPCMSDQECRAGRICHEGRCRFLEEAQRELARDRQSTLPIGSDGGTLAPVTPSTDEVGTAGTLDAGAPQAAELPRGTAMFMGDARHTGRVGFEGPRAEVAPAWTFRTGSRIYASPVVTPAGDILVGSLDQSLTSVTPEGALRFRYSGTGKYYASAVVTPTGDVIAGSLDGSLVSLSPFGQVRWQQKLADGIDASPVLSDDGHLYVAADGLYAFDLSGRMLWHYAVGVHVRSAPAVHPSALPVKGRPA